jgi:PhzF family phenazine biosynthesis protein
MKNLYHLSAFPKTKFGGNKAGVYINADLLTDKEKQKIAKNLGYSETAFVEKSQLADYKVRFFTPMEEVDLCGHATIATFNLLRDLKIIKPGIIKQETKAGILKLDIKDNLVFMQQNKPVFEPFDDLQSLYETFESIELHHKLKPEIISTGLRELFVPVKDRRHLDKLKPIYKHMIEFSNKHNIIGIHVFAIDNQVDAYGRNFAPVLGINEESATGTSNGALACYLYKNHKQKELYTLRQGYSMNQPSEIKAKIDTIDNQIDSIWVGGSAIVIK